MVHALKLSWQKYKWLHVVMWFLVGASTFITYYDKSLTLLPQVGNAFMVILASTIPFYTTAYVLIPRILYKKKYVLFVVLLILLVIVSGIFMMLAVRSVDHFFDPSRAIIPANSASLRFSINIFVWTALIAAFGAGGLKILSDRSRLEKEKISTELNFLRSQVNPHFLFNVMNTIYFQIEKSNTAARDSVEKFSEMLRYQLYECTTDRVEIKKEIEYIKNYVEIQKLRLEKESRVQLTVQENLDGFTIAPLLVLPLLENAFKHISHYRDASQNELSVSVYCREKCFIAEIKNTYEAFAKDKYVMKTGGLGIQNLKRRLQLIYPDAYQLTTSHENGLYACLLQLKINN